MHSDVLYFGELSIACKGSAISIASILGQETGFIAAAAFGPHETQLGSLVCCRKQIIATRAPPLHPMPDPTAWRTILAIAMFKKQSGAARPGCASLTSEIVVAKQDELMLIVLRPAARHGTTSESTVRVRARRGKTPSFTLGVES